MRLCKIVLCLALLVICAGCLMGCELPELLQRLGNIQDHIRIVRTDPGYFGVGIVFELAENPFQDMPFLAEE